MNEIQISPDAPWFPMLIGENEGWLCPQCNHGLHVFIRSAFEGKYKMGCSECGYLSSETHEFAQCPDLNKSKPQVSEQGV